MQAARGDNDTERPMWAEKGGLDFEGRARWDAWTERKGMKPPRAKVLFVQVPLYLPLAPYPADLVLSEFSLHCVFDME